MTKVRFIPMCHMANGMEFGIHVHELVGTAGDGPTVGISGVIHGNEVTGAHIILDLARALANVKFKGRILLLPVANPHGFEANERFVPVDWINLNRVFPGNKQGTFSDHLADLIFREFITKLDVLIDLHSGTDRPTVDYTFIFNDEGLSRSTGSKILYRMPESNRVYDGTSAVAAVAKGIRSVVIEIGGGVIDQAPYAKWGVSSLMNMLRHLEMVEGNPAPLPEQIVVNEIQLVRPTQGGFLETEAPPLGERIRGGDVLGRVISPYTFEELEVMRCPVEDGIMILSHLTRNVIHPGDYGYMIGNMEGHTK
ncbi:MAG: succinylglutamate desuccinylase/aspartoacylase family protein [Cyclobacteriaceae bacterium]